MSVRNGFGVVAAGAVLAASVVALAQQPARQPAQQPQAEGARPGTTQVGAMGNMDTMFASCLTIANQKEVALAEFAQDKAQHEEVKKFAEMMVTDHRACLQKLQRFAPGVANVQLDAANDAGRESTGSVVRPAAGQATRDNGIQQTSGVRQPTTTSATSGPSADLIQIDREIAQECLKSAKERLSKEEGADFDKCFIGFQIAAHAGMKDKLAVLQRHASSELKEVLAEGEKTTKEHLAKAEEIMEELAGKSSETGNRTRTERRQEKREEKNNN